MLFYLVIVFLVLGCASKTKQQMTEPPPHSHYYPFTEVIGDYHLRLIVDHHGGNMALVFEDVAERPVKPIKINFVKGKITFPDGTMKEEKFFAKTDLRKRYRARYYSHKHRIPRERGIFISKAEWLKFTQKFTLEVKLHFKGKDYQLAFQYEVPGGKILYHRR